MIVSRHALFLNSAKKHSVRYDASIEDNDGVGVTAVYIRKEVLPIPYPEVIVLTIETIPTGEE